MKKIVAFFLKPAVYKTIIWTLLSLTAGMYVWSAIGGVPIRWNPFLMLEASRGR